MTDTAVPQDILKFWFVEIARERWFRSSPEFDAGIKRRFEPLWRSARAGELNDWRRSKEGALALILVCDQFPRNMFRGESDAFATDALAREIAREALAKDYDRDATPDERNFFYLPFMHSESPQDQDLSVQLCRERLGEAHSAYRFALKHREAILKFSRFPARNKALNRVTTAEEAAFLAENPAGF